ncbi:MAG: sulfite exporter TauE/SafE family protein [Burkholderiaceae bacterium]|nr:sulfite exporter TauE/SafE family protein [Burkholderiaceae bacterium]
MTDFTAVLLFTDNPLYLALAMVVVVGAYAVFSLVGFGSALMASGPLALVMPVGKVIPMLALLDFAGSSVRGWHARKNVAWGEFSQLFPGMLLGQLAGVLVLSHMPTTLMAVALGLFVVLQGMKGLIKRTAQPSAMPQLAFAYGLLGGVLGGLFGSGGFVYASYLERHLENRVAFRATQAVLIALSTAWRLVLCTWVGLLNVQVALTAMAFVPAMGVGIAIGHHIDLKMSREQLFLLLNCLLVASGLSLVVRYLG